MRLMYLLGFAYAGVAYADLTRILFGAVVGPKVAVVEALLALALIFGAARNGVRIVRDHKSTQQS